MMGPIFLHADEFIRERNFPVNVPVFYEPHMTEAMIAQVQSPRPQVNPYRMVAVGRRNPAPFRHIHDPKQMQYACYSIQIMIDMCQKKIEFVILNDEDIPEILDGLDRYLVYLRDDVEAGDENIVMYARKVLKFREMVYKHYFRFMKTNPAALEGIYPNGSTKKNIFNLLAIGCRKENLHLDPLAARAYPPYDLTDALPKTGKENENSEIIFESSLGISQSGANKDNDFNLDNFLGIKR